MPNTSLACYIPEPGHISPASVAGPPTLSVFFAPFLVLWLRAADLKHGLVQMPLSLTTWIEGEVTLHLNALAGGGLSSQP